GEYTIKHGEIVHLYSYYDGEIGNLARPQHATPLVTAVKVPSVPAPAALVLHTPSLESRKSETLAAPESSGAHGLKVALLYKRHAKPDDHVLNLLETKLQEHGCRVFVDRHLTIGVEWAQEIERQVRSADAVIPILSEAAIHSEMLDYEILT